MTLYDKVGKKWSDNLCPIQAIFLILINSMKHVMNGLIRGAKWSIIEDDQRSYNQRKFYNHKLNHSW